MSEEKMIRLSQAARELNVGIHTLAEALVSKGFAVENKANSKITIKQFEMLGQEFGFSPVVLEQKINNLNLTHKMATAETEVLVKEEVEVIEPVKEVVAEKKVEEIKKEEPVLKEENLEQVKVENGHDKKTEEKPAEKVNITHKLEGLKVVNKIDLNPKKDKSKDQKENEKENKIKSKEKANSETQKTEKQKSQPLAEEKISKKDEDVKLPLNNEKVEITVEKVEKETIQLKQEEKVEKETIQLKQEEKFNVNPVTEAKEEENLNKEPEKIKRESPTLKGLTVVGKIELPVDKNKNAKQPVASSDDKENKKRKRKKKRIRRNDQQQPLQQNQTQNNKPNENNPQSQQKTTQRDDQNKQNNNNKNKQQQGHQQQANQQKQVKKQPETSESDIQSQIKATLAQLSNKKGAKLKRKPKTKFREEGVEEEVQDQKLLKVTEFISANDLANLMNVSVNQVISVCMSMGMFVSINQRLDAEAITVISDEFGFDVEFISTTEDDKMVAAEEEEVESDEELEPRAPIVTIMGHVDHGKTSLLDYIRKSNVTASESGGITQHIGAYDVMTSGGKRIAFLDTPGHEAFTAMRARGAKITDIVILVVAADDSVMPQTKEAINHAKVAGVPIVVAINKVDKPTANPHKIREELANEGILVESWGGKYQDQEVSAKTGMGIEDLLEKVLLEAELLELKANPDKKAKGTIIEASLDKGRGYIATVMVQSGTLKIGDVILAGSHYGRVKAMNDHRGQKLTKAGPSTPVQVLGLDGAPQAGDIMRAMANEREAREIALKREQIMREQNIRATKGLTLEEIGRRRALGTFKELRIIVKGDVDGSVEALSDSLLKLSTPEIEIKIIHKAVGQISEADILLASASEAIIIGFQVRPSPNAKKAAEQEKVQIKLYSIIYNAIGEIKDAMEGMLAPKVEEVIVGNAEVRDTFKISKIGTIAGCYVTDGYIKKNNKIRLIRDGIVTYEGELSSLKRFKEDVGEVKSGYECGLGIKNFNDIKTGDVIESFEEKETKRTL